MKKVLNLVLSCDYPPYDRMVTTSCETWDSIHVEGVETVYYFARSNKPNTDKFIYLPVNESLNTMGLKLLAAFDWALKNKEFDYLARPHSCIYVNKKELIKYVQELPAENVFAGLKVDATPPWAWGGCGFVLSRDVVQKVVDNMGEWEHNLMEDQALSFLINKLEIPYTQGKGCSIDKLSDRWQCMCYGSESYLFDDFSEIKKDNGQFFFRVKQDYDRKVDDVIMRFLFKTLNDV